MERGGEGDGGGGFEEECGVPFGSRLGVSVNTTIEMP